MLPSAGEMILKASWETVLRLPLTRSTCSGRGMDSGVTAISAGNIHTCAIKDDAAFCWGSDRSGQLGDGQPSMNRESPVQVEGLDSSVQVSRQSIGSPASIPALFMITSLMLGSPNRWQVGIP